MWLAVSYTKLDTQIRCSLNSGSLEEYRIPNARQSIFSCVFGQENWQSQVFLN